MKTAAAEVVTGTVVATTPLWGIVVDQIIYGAHAVAVVTGAIIGLHGVWRIWRKSRGAI